jgi:hypothetical protein
MGVAAFGALVAIGLALIGQTPSLSNRLGLRLDRSIRALTGYGFAFLLLALGFFLAGVPLTGLSAAEVDAAGTVTPTAGGEELLDGSGQSLTALAGGVTRPPSTAITGAFEGPPARTATLSVGEGTAGAEGDGPVPSVTAPTVETTATGQSGTGTPTRTRAPSVTPLPTSTASPTRTATPTATATATPTPTATPIEGETALVSTGGSSVWLKRSPGGQNLTITRHGDILIILSGHANQGGVQWQEVSTVQGEIGWIQVEFLDFQQEE